ncbi:MAG: signal peptidase I [Actinomycetota bacterium]
MGSAVVKSFAAFRRGKWSLKHVVLGISLLLAAVISPFKLGVVSGVSMSPTMKNGSFYLMDRSYFRTDSINRDDIVVFKHDNASFIKRVVAVPGDTIYLVRYSSGGQDELVLAWQLARLRRAINQSPWKRGMKLVASQLGPGEYFVVGDNLPGSEDSRLFGPIPSDAIQGKVLFAPPPPSEAPRFAQIMSAAGRP